MVADVSGLSPPFSGASVANLWHCADRVEDRNTRRKLAKAWFRAAIPIGRVPIGRRNTYHPEARSARDSFIASKRVLLRNSISFFSTSIDVE